MRFTAYVSELAPVAGGVRVALHPVTLRDATVAHSPLGLLFANPDDATAFTVGACVTIDVNLAPAAQAEG